MGKVGYTTAGRGHGVLHGTGYPAGVFFSPPVPWRYTGLEVSCKFGYLYLVVVFSFKVSRVTDLLSYRVAIRNKELLITLFGIWVVRRIRYISTFDDIRNYSTNTES